MITESTATNPLAFLQSQPEEKTKGKGSDEMGQSDFIELMLAQMKNQDPTDPLDPNEFMSQLAQFSAVNGIQELKQSVDRMMEMLAADQSIKAANLVGREVMGPGGHVPLDAGGRIQGRVVLDHSTTDLTVKIFASNGALVRTLPLGMHGEGRVSFTWDGFRDDGQPAAPGLYRIVAESETDDGTLQVPVEVRTRVESVDLRGAGGELMLNLANGGTVPLSAVEEIL